MPRTRSSPRAKPRPTASDALARAPADAPPPAPPPAAPAPPKGGLAELRSFGKTFWLINSVEMVERGAYYGIISVLSYHLITQLRIATPTVGLAIGLLQALLYFVPLVAAALAEKYGYRKGLGAAFALALAGYLLLGMLGVFRSLAGDLALLPGILLLGFGAGTFKPIAAAAIARATTEGQRNLGFTIYYAGVNVGGFLGPLLIGILVPEAFYGAVFYGAAAFIALNLLISLTLYRDQVAPRKDRTVAQALRTLVDLKNDPMYLVLLLFYAAFWFMYAQQQFFLGQYMADYLTMPAWFTVPLVATINPATIILVGPFIGKATQRRPSLPLIVLGTALYIVGMTLVGLFTVPMLFVVGVVVFSIGEVMVQPNFLSYSSKVAPQDRVAVYLGYSFLPVGVGLVTGSAVGATLYHQFAEVQHTPAAYWILSALAGAVCMAGLLAINRSISQKRADPSGELGPRARRVVHSRAAPVAAVLVVPLLLLAAALPGEQAFHRAGQGVEVASLPAGKLAEVRLPAVQGSTDEGQQSSVPVRLAPAEVQDLTFTLRWQDEPASAGPLPTSPATNTPDRFALHVTLPNGTMLMQEGPNAQGAEGALTVVVPRAPGGDYQVAVELKDAGDPQVPPGVAIGQDTGNAWTLDASYLAPAAA
jgi:dipeptide/tripeptide permease